MANEIHKNDIGTEFRCTITDQGEIVDLSTASLIQIIFQKPSGSTLTKNASMYTNGTDGIIYYISVSTDLDEVGKYKIQAYVNIGGSEFYSSLGTFKVHHNLV